MSDTLKQTAPLVSLALLCRLVLAFWPVDAVSTSQSALLSWPAFLVVIILSLPAVHFARRWGTRSEAAQMGLSPGPILKALALGAFLALPLIGWDMLFRLPRDLHILGPQAVPSDCRSCFEHPGSAHHGASARQHDPTAHLLQRRAVIV